MIWVLVTVGCVLLGIVLAGFGAKLMSKTGSLLLSLTPQPTKEKDFLKVGFLTKNWLRLPDKLYHGIMRITDVAVIWYEKTALPGYDPGIFVVRSDGKMLYTKCKPDVGTEIVEVIAVRNPWSVTVRCFAYEGENYDAFQDPQKAAALYCRQWA